MVVGTVATLYVATGGLIGLPMVGGAASTAAAAGGATATAAAGSTAVAAGTATAAGAATSGPLSVGLSLASAGPAGWAILIGAETSSDAKDVTFDCWKPVLRDESTEPSKGKMLKELVKDPRIKRVCITEYEGLLPQVTLENIWGELFRIDYVTVPSISNVDLFGHSVRIA